MESKYCVHFPLKSHLALLDFRQNLGKKTSYLVHTTYIIIFRFAQTIDIFEDLTHQNRQLYSKANVKNTSFDASSVLAS